MKRQKFTAAETAEGIADALRPALALMLRARDRGQPIEGMLRDLMDTLAAKIPQAATLVISSPYDNVSDDEWRDAYEEAAQTICEREDSEREPTHEEVEHALESMRERYDEDRRHAYERERA
jgi:hypothetical protein